MGLIDIIAQTPDTWIVKIDKNLGIVIWKNTFEVDDEVYPLKLFFRNAYLYEYKIDENYNRILEVAKEWVKNNQQKIDDANQMYNNLK